MTCTPEFLARVKESYWDVRADFFVNVASLFAQMVRDGEGGAVEKSSIGLQLRPSLLPMRRSCFSSCLLLRHHAAPPRSDSSIVDGPRSVQVHGESARSHFAVNTK